MKTSRFDSRNSEKKQGSDSAAGSVIESRWIQNKTIAIDGSAHKTAALNGDMLKSEINAQARGPFVVWCVWKPQEDTVIWGPQCCVVSCGITYTLLRLPSLTRPIVWNVSSHCMEWQFMPKNIQRIPHHPNRRTKKSIYIFFFTSRTSFQKPRWWQCGSDMVN